jgi:chromosomal replication initiation ATPase DnaA
VTIHICTRCGHAEPDDPDRHSGTPPDHLAWIIERVAADSDQLTVEGILAAKNRARHLLHARRRIYLILRLSFNSYPQIARMFGKDHSTIMYSVNNATEFDREYAGTIFREYRTWARTLEN